MAEAKFTLTIHEGSRIRTIIVNQPSSDKLVGIDYSNENNSVNITFKDFKSVSFKFATSALRSNFVSSLITGFETGTTFALDNLGPVATTTTSTTSTTTTTTSAP